MLTFSDLVLPGNAGRELRFQRTYNSKTGAWTFGIAGVPLHIVNPPYPSPQWVEPPTFQQATPTLLMSDGGQRSLAWYQQPNLQEREHLQQGDFERLLAVRFGRARPAGCRFRTATPVTTKTIRPTDWLRVSSCMDAFSNTIEFDWTQPSQLVVTQTLSASVSRFDTAGSARRQHEKDGRDQIGFQVRYWCRSSRACSRQACSTDGHERARRDGQLRR